MTQYFIDHDAVDDEDTVNTYTFTKDSDEVTVPGDQTAFWQVDDYIRSNDSTYGIEWYKITAVSYDETNDVTTITLDHAFYQESHSAGAQKNSQYRLWKADNGASGNGQSVDKAFCHIQQFFDVAQAGDVGYVRRGKTYYVSKPNMSVVNDGTPTSPIVLMGDDGTGWPTETGLAKPVIDFQSKVFNYNECCFYVVEDYYWKIKDIKFENADLYSGYEYLSNLFRGAVYWVFEDVDCDTVDAIFGSDYNQEVNVKLRNCNITNGVVFFAGKGECELQSCNISVSSDFYRAFFGSYSNFKIFNSSIDAGSFRVQGKCEWINGDLLSAGAVTEPSILKANSVAHLENVNGIDASYYYSGKIERDDSNYTGSATTSIKVTPNSNCSLDYGICAFEWKITNVSGGVEHTVKVYVMGGGWQTFPTADELWIEVEYISDATTGATSIVKSTDVLTANDTWTAFTVTFTPAADGDIYVRGYLAKYDTDENGNPCVVWFNGEVEIT